MAFVNDRDMISKACEILRVVGHEKAGDTRESKKLRQLITHFALRSIIESRHRFIQEQPIRLPDDRTGQRDSLPLAPGKLMGFTRKQIPYVQCFGQPSQFFPDTFLGKSYRIPDICLNGKMGKESIVLKNHSNLSSLGWNKDAL